MVDKLGLVHILMIWVFVHLQINFQQIKYHKYVVNMNKNKININK
jgi:hypothetical protein